MEEDTQNSVCRFLRRAAEQHPGAPAVEIDGNIWSYEALWRRATAIGDLLADELAPHSRVALLAENGPDYVALYWGILSSGCVTVELNPGLGDLELGQQLRNADPALLIAESQHTSRLRSAGFAAAGERVLVRRVSATGDAARLASAIAGVLDDDSPVAGEPKRIGSGDDLASIVHTSGTTGVTKGVCLTHANLAWTTRSIAESFGLSQGSSPERFAGNLPLFYTYGKSVLHLATYLAAPIVFSPQLFTPTAFLAELRQQRVTHLSLVPYLCNLLLRSEEFRHDRLTDLRRITIAGGALTGEPLLEMFRRFPDRILPMYGLTEAATRVVCMPGAEAARRPASCGRPIPGVTVTILDDSGARVAPGEVGEVAVSGPNVMQGYFRDPEGTDTALRGGWLLTGDIGSLDEQGYLSISGRRKEMIKIFGESVSAVGVEAVINTLAGVKESAVVGTPHPVSGEAICAFVVLAPDASIDDETIRQHCAAALGKARVPAQIRFIDELPRTPSGKIRKNLLVLD